ncbi:SPOR domain-containing protein [Croceicoccus bisphenolivorans]|uniref:SPOR domain-containing protein n=1 Tax=Croceicoccus bisphenolivorans TaxID=1783232 RepID=UPI0009EF47BF|nr:SPOR domain-containing protein [Croceicoccus bisphenolivorans]
MNTQTGDSEGQLALGEPELRLPWLESADEDADEGLDWSRVGKFAAALVIVLLIVAMSVFMLREYMSAPPEGDGSLIEAPDTPYKVRPKDPGGMTVAGTGDTSYEVGEGVDNEATLAQSDPVPVPTPSASASAKPSSAPEPPLSGVAVQIGAYSTEADARKGWDTIRSRYEPLGGYDRRIVQGRADIGVVYRLQAVAGSTSAAFALCDDMRRNGIECQVKR